MNPPEWALVDVATVAAEPIAPGTYGEPGQYPRRIGDRAAVSEALGR